MGESEPDHAHEEGLLEVGDFLEADVLDDGRQLVMVADHDEPFDCFFMLHGKREECLDLKDLPCFFEEDVVVLEVEFYESLPLECSMGACHGDDFSLFADDVVASFFLVPEYLESPALTDLLEQSLEAMLLEIAFLVGFMLLLVILAFLIGEDFRSVAHELQEIVIESRIEPFVLDHEVQEEFCCFASELFSERVSEAALEFLCGSKQVHASLEHEVDPSFARELLLQPQLLLSNTESEQVFLVDVQVRDLLKDIIERMVRMCDHDGTFSREVIVKQAHDLNCHIRLASSRWT